MHRVEDGGYDGTGLGLYILNDLGIGQSKGWVFYDGDGTRSSTERS